MAIGTLFIYSSSSVYAMEKYGSPHYFVKKQIIGLILGIIAFLIGRTTPLSMLFKTTPFIMVTSIGITALTLIPQLSSHIHGASRWITIKGFSFQPSELLKIGFLMGMAYFFEKKANNGLSTISYYSWLVILILIPSLILLGQPDFGFTVVLVTSALLMFFIARVPLKKLALTVCALIPIAIGLIIHKPYRLKRVLTFLNPWDDPRGNGFQIIQSFIAIGSGHIWGLGIGNSKQKFFYLPMQHTDFIFSIIAEETGFIGTSIIIALYFMLLFSGMRLACAFKRPFELFLTLGFTFWISLQAIINIAVTTGLAPTKGVGLPFVSYGNTALITNLFIMGIITQIVSIHQDHPLSKRTQLY